MKKFFKYSLWLVAGIMVIAIVVGAYIAATFNPNDYKAQVIQLVKEKKQRTLKLDGDIKLVFFPDIGADIGQVSLSEFQSDKQFVAIDKMRVSLALWPLLSKKIVVNEVEINGLRATLVKNRNGKINVDDLLAQDKVEPDAASPMQFDIASVRVEKTEINYHDELSGAKYSLKDINLKTGRIKVGVPSKIEFSAQIQSSQPKINLAPQLQAMLTFDLEKKLYQVQEMTLHAKGTVLDINNLDLQASGNASANLLAQAFTADKLSVAASGTMDKDNFNFQLDAPALTLTKDKFAGEKFTLNAKLDGGIGNIVAALTLHDLSGNAQLFRSNALTLDLDVQQVEQAFKIKLASPLSGNFEQQQFNLSNLTVAVNATGDKLPNKSISSEMKGSVQMDGSRKSIQANLAGGLLQSQIKARVAVNNFSAPDIRFDVEVDQFDADLYLPKKKTSPGAPAGNSASAGNAATGEKPLDLTALKKLNVEGALRVGALKVANIKLAQVRLDMKARNGQLNIAPLSANLYQGTLNGSLGLNVEALPRVTINQKLSGINIAPLLQDALSLDMLEGRGNVSLNLSAQGNTMSMLKKALRGDMALNLADGAVKGINLAQKIRDAQVLFGKGASQTQAADKNEKTDFSEMRASFKVNNGVAHNEDLSLKSPLLRVSGNGDVDLGLDTINYLVKATLAKTLAGQGGADKVAGLTVPVRVSGPYTSLKYTLDFNAMVSDTAKQKFEEKFKEKKEELKSKVQDQLEDKLRGLFK